MTTGTDETTPAAEQSNPRIQQVLSAVEAAEITPDDALRISLELLGFVEGYHLETLEDLLEDGEADPLSVAIWAADSARLKTAREVLEEVLGVDSDDDSGDDGDASADIEGDASADFEGDGDSPEQIVADAAAGA